MIFGKREQLPYCLSDCDGTIALPNFTVPEETVKDIIKYQKKSGYHFGIITGRNYIVNKQLIAKLKIQLPVVSCNGALIVDPNSHKVLDAEYIDKETCINIFRAAAKLGLDVVAYTSDAMVGTPTSNRIQAWSNYRKTILDKKYLFDIVTYDDLNKLADQIANETVKPLELVITAFDKSTQDKAKELVGKYATKIDYIESQVGQYNVLKKDVNKGSALKKWAEIIGVEAKDVVVFGDNYNDEAMFKIADKKYAVGNAVDKLKDVATETIDSINDNGVGKKLEELMK